MIEHDTRPRIRTLNKQLVFDLARDFAADRWCKCRQTTMKMSQDLSQRILCKLTFQTILDFLNGLACFNYPFQWDGQSKKINQEIKMSQQSLNYIEVLSDLQN